MPLQSTVLLASSLTWSVLAYNNGMGKKPPMGWQTWCSVGPCGTDHCFDGQIRAMADTLVSSGMKDLGYNWVILDDCWHPSRDKNGTLVPFPRFFPNGMKPVIDYVHSKGLQFGLYTSVGDKTCHGGWSPGSFGHYEQDADTFAAWEVDYVKIDWCGKHDSIEGHKNMSKALNRTGRPISYMMCRGPYQSMDEWGYAPDIAQGWRANGDHHDSFSSTLQQVNSVRGKGTWSKPYGWAYLDMMMTGGQGCEDQGTGGGGESGHWNWSVPKHCPGHTDDEYRSEASFYVIVSSPMMVGTDIRLMTPIMKELLLNKEAIAINQDYEAVPGDLVPACGGGPAPEQCSVQLDMQLSGTQCELGKNYGCINGTTKMWTEGGCRGVFTCNGKAVNCDRKREKRYECDCSEGEVGLRRMTNGDFAIAMPNFGSTEAEISFCLNTLKWPHGDTAKVRNVWAKTDLGTITNNFTAKVKSHDTLLLRISPASQAVVV